MRAKVVHFRFDGQRGRMDEIRPLADGTKPTEQLISHADMFKLHTHRKLLIGLVGAFLASGATACPDGQLTFSFRNLEVTRAYAVLADFAGLRPVIDQSIPYSSPMYFGCTPWRSVAESLAAKYQLVLRFEGDVMYVSRR